MHKRFLSRRVKRLVSAGVASASLVGGSLAVGVPPAHAVNEAYSCAYRVNLSLFGGPYGTQGCAPQTSQYATANSLSPSVTGPPSASQTDNDGAKAVYGPAVLFSSPYDANDNTTNSGQLLTQVTTGTTNSALARAMAVGPSPFWTKTPTSWQPSPDGTIGYVRASCSATSPTQRSSSVLIKHGVVDTSTDSEGYPTSQVAVPQSPTRGYRVNFTIDNVGDHGHIIFNEVIDHGNGSFTVNAAHIYMEGPTALGDMVIGQVKCGK